MADGRVFATGRARPGRSLADVLAAQGPLAPARADALVDQVTSALEAIEASACTVCCRRRRRCWSPGRCVGARLSGAAEDGRRATPAGLATERLHQTMSVARSPRPRAHAAPRRLRGRGGGRRQAPPSPRSASSRPARRRPPARLTRLDQHRPTAARVGARAGRARRRADPARCRPRGVGSVAVGAGAVWVATESGTLLRIDPRANRVVGAPMRFGPAASSTVTVAPATTPSGSRTSPRHADARRPAQRARHRAPAVRPRARRARRAEGTSRSRAPAAGRRHRQPAPAPTPARCDRSAPGCGRAPALDRHGGGRVWVTAFDGTVTRLDPRTGEVTRMRAASTGSRPSCAMGGCGSPTTSARRSPHPRRRWRCPRPSRGWRTRPRWR